MRLKILLVILISFVASCETDTSPEVMVCVHNAELRVWNCNSNKTNKHYDLAEEQTDKYISLSPDDWLARENYVKELKKQLLDCKKP